MADRSTVQMRRLLQGVSVKRLEEASDTDVYKIRLSCCYDDF